MSRFIEYDDYDGEGPPPAFWWRAVENCLNGRRGQAILRELREALLALPEKRLIEGYLIQEGQVCALGALAKYRAEQGRLTLTGWSTAHRYYDKNTVADVTELERAARNVDDDWSTREFGRAMGLPEVLAFAISYENDEPDHSRYNTRVQTDEQRYEHVLDWVNRRIKHDA